MSISSSLLKACVVLLAALFLLATAQQPAVDAPPMLDGVETHCCLVDGGDHEAESESTLLWPLPSTAMLLIPFLPLLARSQQRYRNPDPSIPIRPPRA